MKFGKAYADSFAIYRSNLGALLVGGAIAATVSLICQAIQLAILGHGFGSSPDAVTGGSETIGRAFLALVFSIVAGLAVIMPLAFGALNICVRFAKTGRQGGAFSVFDVFYHWVRLFCLSFAMGFILWVMSFAAGIVVGLILGAAIGVAGVGWTMLVIWVVEAFFVTMWMYAPAIVLDYGGGAFNAMSHSHQLVSRAGYLRTMAALIPVYVAAWFVISVLTSTLLHSGSGTGASLVVDAVVRWVVVVPWLATLLVSMYMQSDGRSEELDAAIAGRPVRKVAAPIAPAYETSPFATAFYDPGAALTEEPVSAGSAAYPDVATQPDVSLPAPRVDPAPPWETPGPAPQPPAGR